MEPRAHLVVGGGVGERGGGGGGGVGGAPPLFCTPEEPDAEFDGAVADPKTVEEAWRRWREEVAFADDFVARTASLGATFEIDRHGRMSLREVLVHMVEEYARHNGHADLLRERIDGRVGQ
ncbi:DUF664 domain-containing protein [Nocardiopsis sp. NPDC050513]|uniref:mycothiol transferase n=1 Tax=Nocardiopsis sp. NPDC050513 TaxID=3364338 RepID=UPI0037A3706F